MAAAAETVTAKAALRTQARTKRAGLVDASGPALAAAVADVAAAFLDARRELSISAYASMPDELDTRPLLQKLAGQGFELALPVMSGKNAPLTFRRWLPGDVMVRRQWGIQEPSADKPEIVPDVVLVPLLAFDRRGFRLGYGGGYYDRTLSALRRRKTIIAAGLALDEQEVDDVPHLDYDERLDWVLTPSGPRDLRG